MNRPADLAPRATYADLLAAPPQMVAELIDGALHLQPRPRPRDAVAHSVLSGAINGAFHRGRDGPGGWWILFEPELHLGDDVLVPDIAGWRRARMPAIPDAAFFTLAPDWVCEVLSPGTRRLDLTAKRAIYAAQGVAHLWFVDPDARTLEVFAAREGLWTLVAALGGDAEIRQPPFDAIAFPLGALWPDPEPEADRGADPA